MKTKQIERTRERFDTELALTNDILGKAQELALLAGWRVAVHALLYVAMRLTGGRGRALLVAFLSDPSVGW